MKVFVSGKFEKRQEVRKLMDLLISLGHEISCDWTTHVPCKPYVENQERARKYGEEEVNGICSCDVLIYLSEETGTTLNMELGAALALAKKTGKPKIFAVGKFNSKSPWFFHPLVKRVDSLDEALEELKLLCK